MSNISFFFINIKKKTNSALLIPIFYDAEHHSIHVIILTYNNNTHTCIQKIGNNLKCIINKFISIRQCKKNVTARQCKKNVTAAPIALRRDHKVTYASFSIDGNHKYSNRKRNCG